MLENVKKKKKTPFCSLGTMPWLSHKTNSYSPSKHVRATPKQLPSFHNQDNGKVEKSSCNIHFIGKFVRLGELIEVTDTIYIPTGYEDAASFLEA